MVQGTKQEIRPDVNGQAWKQKNARQCAACEAIKEKDLATCSRSVLFLGRDPVAVAVVREGYIVDCASQLTYADLAS